MACLYQYKIPQQYNYYIRHSGSSARRSPLPIRVTCGLRNGPPKSLWRSHVLSKEAILAIYALKLAAKSSVPDQMDSVLRGRVDRLIKSDIISVLVELRKQNQLDLALQVFAFIRKLEWYKPDISLYNGMILMAGKNKLVEVAQDLFAQLKNEGLEPDSRTYTEMIGVFLQGGMIEEAMNLYTIMKESGCNPDKLTLTILIRNLDKLGRSDLASGVRDDCEDFLDFPEKFLEEVDKVYPKRRSIKVV